MRILDVALKDLRQLIFDWRTALFFVAMPIAFTLLFAFAFSGGGEAEVPRLPVAFIDQDGESVLSTHLLALLDASDTIRPVLLKSADTKDAQDQVAEEELAAAVIIPAGYSEQVLSQAEPAPQPVVILDPNSPAGQAAQNALQAAFTRMLGAVEAARLTALAYEGQGATAGQAFLAETIDRAIQAWSDPPLTIATSQSGTLATESEEATDQASNSAHSSAGVMVQFTMAGLMGAAEILVVERKSGTMRRLLTTPIARIEIILGHSIAMFAMILAQLTMLIAFGQLVLGVDYLREPVATLVMLLTTGLWATSLGLLIGIFSRTEEQVIIFSIIIMLLLSGLGGAWMPLEFTSEAFQTIGHLMPTAWAIDGFENIVVRGLGLESVLLPAAIILGFAAMFFAVAVWRFRFE